MLNKIEHVKGEHSFARVCHKIPSWTLPHMYKGLTNTKKAN